MRTRENPRTRFALLLLAVVLTGCFQSISVQAQDSRWHFRLRGVLLDGDQAFSIEESSRDVVLASGSTTLGAGVAIEYRISDRLGVELGVVYARVPESSWLLIISLSEGPTFVPVSASLNLHLSPNRRFDFYIAPAIAYVIYGDFDLDLGEETLRYTTDDDFAWGGTIGLDIPFGGSSWAFNAAASFLSSDMEVSERGSNQKVSVSVDPVMVYLGVTFTF